MLALLFAVFIPGIGHPDLGDRFVVLSLLAGADIVLEFVSHGPGLITVSVIVSVLGLGLAEIASRRQRHPV